MGVDEFGEDLRTYCLSKSGITSLIGARMYAGKMPQGNKTFPVTVYTIISQVPGHVLSGAADYCQSRVQLDHYAPKKIDAVAVAKAFRNQLQGFPVTSASSMGNSTVTSCVYLGSLDLYDEPRDGSDVGLFRISADYWFRHSQSEPTFA